MRKLIHTLAWSSAAVAVAVAFTHPAVMCWLPGCPFHALTGLYCPGCGMTRAVQQLVHGHAVAAFGLNPLAFVLLPVAAWLSWRGSDTTVKPVWTASLVAVIITFSIVRNIPVYPFTLLAP